MNGRNSEKVPCLQRTIQGGKSPSQYCSHNCRPSSQNAFRGPLHRGAENPDLACLQPIENIDAAPGHFQEFRPTRSSASFRFEEYPERPSKKASCVTYKLTDGQQINTG
jgi:hypothetical protein